MDSKQQQQSKKPQQQPHGDDLQRAQVGKENKQQDAGKDFGKDVKQQGRKQQDVGGDLNQGGKDTKQQGLGSGGDLNQRSKDLGKDVKQQDVEGDLPKRGKHIPKDTKGEQKVSPGDESDLPKRGKDIPKDTKGEQKVSPGDDIPIKDKDFDKNSKEQKLGVGDKETLRMQEFPDSKDSMTLKDCGCCGRHFFADRVAKHEKACEKAHKERELFDSREQRLEGLEIDEKQVGSASKETKPSSSQWKQVHDEFLSQLRSAKKGPREQKFDAEPKVPAQQKGMGKELQQKDVKQGTQQKDIKQDSKQKESKLQGLEKGGLAGQDASLSEEAPLGSKKGKVASDSPAKRQSYNQPTR
jgi:hypothetical protein